MADESQAPPPTQPPAVPLISGGPGNALNERTYQEVEYLKRNLGPILVAALAEICIRRPADPIEYLGHWLLRWRYNEELKRRDVQNALEVVRRKTWNDGTGMKEAEINQQQPLILNTVAPDQAPAPETFGEGFIPSHPYAAPGYGGPLTAEQLKTVTNTTEPPPVVAAAPPPPPPLADSDYPPPEEAAPMEVMAPMVPEAGPPPPEEFVAPSYEQPSPDQGLLEEQTKAPSLIPTGSGEKKASLKAAGSGEKRGSGEKKGSLKGAGSGEKRGSLKGAGSGEKKGSLKHSGSGGAAEAEPPAPPPAEE